MKEIPLTKGQVALVDDEDYEILMKYKWQAKYDRGINGYYATCNAGGIMVLMHRVIMRAKPGEIWDHSNHNTLDNTRINLRPCSHSQNHANQNIRNDNACMLKGVSKHNSSWRADIHLNGKTIYLGMFVSPQLAAIAYDQAALRYFRDFALTNAMLGLV